MYGIIHTAYEYGSLFRGTLYSFMLFAADLITMASRRDDISRKFFRNHQVYFLPTPSSTRSKDGIP